MGENKATTYKFKIKINDKRFYKEDINYGIYGFLTEENLPHLEKCSFNKGSFLGILSGNMQELEIDMEYKVEATIKYNSKYDNYTYCPSIVLAEKPNTLEKQKRFLESLCTNTQANSLLATYPNVVDMILNNEFIDLSCVKGVKEKTFAKIKDKVLKNYIIQDILILLKPLGVTYKTIKKLIDFQENPILLKKQILENPYILTSINGLGFVKVDEIALKLKPELKVSKFRTIAYLNYTLNKIAQSEGNAWITKNELLAKVRKDIRDCVPIYKELLIKEEKNPKLLYLKDDTIGLLKNYNIDYEIKKRIDYLDGLESMFKPFTDEEVEESIKQTEKELGFELEEEQRQAIKNSNKHNVVIVTAPAGAGKSTVIKGIINLLKNARIKEEFLQKGFNQIHEDDKVSKRMLDIENEIARIEDDNSLIQIGQCALSAKAAKRMKEVSGLEAQTIHRILGWSGEREFIHDKNFPMPYHVNIVDELSMINDLILLKYLNAIKPHSKLILIFDFAQLPPIGMGDFSRDILLYDNICINKFTKVHRQGQKSGILMDANKIRSGENPLKKPINTVNGELKDMHYVFSNDKKKIHNIAINTYLKTIKEIDINDVCIITPRKKNCINSVFEINLKIQDILLPNEKGISRWKDGKQMQFKLGAKVMQKDNNYDKWVFNGDEGYITKIEKSYFEITFNLEDGQKIIKYTLAEIDQIDLAYAISVHSSQGSQYHTVISIFDSNSSIMLNRNLLYTALTRAKTRHLLLAEPKAFKACIDDKNNKPRNTYTRELFLNNENK